MRISDWSSDVCSSDLTLQILSAQGLPTPKTILCKFPVDVELNGRELGFPVVVKTLIGTRGTGVLLCMDRDQFADLAARRQLRWPVERRDRKSVVEGKSVSVRVDLGGRRIINNKKKRTNENERRTI